MNNETGNQLTIASAVENLVESGNGLLIKAAEQEGILASALIAASGLGSRAGTPPGIAEIACLLVTVGLAVGVHLGLGVWKLSTAKKWIFGKQTLRSATIWLPTVGLCAQTLSFFGGLFLFLIRISH